MEQESTKTRKDAKCFPSERFRSFVYFVTTVCLLTCIVFQFASVQSIKRHLAEVKSELTAISKGFEDRLAVIENKVSLISKELKRSQSEHKGRFEMKRSATRQKRTINPQVSLSDLNKRITHWKAGTITRRYFRFMSTYSACTFQGKSD